MLLTLMLRMMFLIVTDASATERNSLVKTYDVETCWSPLFAACVTTRSDVSGCPQDTEPEVVRP